MINSNERPAPNVIGTGRSFHLFPAHRETFDNPL